MSAVPTKDATQAHKAPAAAHASEDADDLDDLDDILDEFNEPSSSKAASGSAVASAVPGPPSAPAPAAPSAAVVEDDEDDDGMDGILSQNFAKELAQGMEALMKELGSAPPGQDPTGLDTSGNEQMNEQELMKQFEAMMAGFGGGAAPAAAKTPSKARETAPAAAGTKAPSAGNFNDAIAATLAKLKESDATATATSSSAADNPFAALGGAGGDEMAKLLAALGGAGGEGADGGLDNPELAKMLEGMMDELMSRDILYEPLKELRDKYPAYLEGEQSRGISAEDRKRYEEQSKCINQIVTLFDDPNYDAKNKEMTTKIQDLMNHMQDCGSPPQEIVGDMPAELENIPGFGAAAGANGEECTIM